MGDAGLSGLEEGKVLGSNKFVLDTEGLVLLAARVENIAAMRKEVRERREDVGDEKQCEEEIQKEKGVQLCDVAMRTCLSRDPLRPAKYRP